MHRGDYRQLKRGHSPDPEGGNFRAGYGPPGYHQQSHYKRQRGEFHDQPLTIEEKIIRLGEVGSRSSNIGLLAKEISDELANKVSEEQKIKDLTAQICRCIVSFPTRVSTYATLIGFISSKHYNVSCQIINSLHLSYPVYLEAQKWQEALIIIHLLSNLVNCKVIRPSALLSQFELMLEVAIEENSPQVRSDYYVYTVMSSLPFVALEVSTQPESLSALEKILTTIEEYLAGRSKNHLNVTRVWLSSDSTTQMDYLDSLWVQLKNFRANGWTETFLYRPYKDKEYRDLMESSLIAQNSPTIQIPAHSSEFLYPCPRIVFRLYEDDATEDNATIPGSDKIERFCIENHIRYVIDELSCDPKDCARHLSHMHRSEQLPIKHLLIETILGELFVLPQPKHPQILYQSLLCEFTKIFQVSKHPNTIKYNYNIVLNESVRILFENLETMNITCLDRFIEWFSFHLNNTEYLFPWQTWAEATEKNRDSPKPVFVETLLSRCIRFSFHKKMSTLVSEHLATLVPPEAYVQYKPVFTDNPKTPELASLVKKLIVEKAQGPQICEALNIVIEGVELPSEFSLKDEDQIDKLTKIDVFTAVILSIASKTLTHLSSAIGKFKSVFKALINTDGGQAQLLTTMHSCSEHHPQLQAILVEKLIKAELIETNEVIDWLFSDKMKPYHLKSYTWELLNTATTQSYLLIEKLQDEDKKLKESAEKVEISKPDGDVEMSEGAEDVKSNVLSDIGPAIKKAQDNYYDCMLRAFQLFAETISDHIKNCEQVGVSYMDNWFRWMTGRMQQLFYNHYPHLLCKYPNIMNIIEATPSIGSSIVNLSQ